jgi:hypothetical protein
LRRPLAAFRRLVLDERLVLDNPDRPPLVDEGIMPAAADHQRLDRRELAKFCSMLLAVCAPAPGAYRIDSVARIAKKGPFLRL